MKFVYIYDYIYIVSNQNGKYFYNKTHPATAPEMTNRIVRSAVTK